MPLAPDTSTVGRLTQAFGRLFFKQAEITDAKAIGADFYVIEMHSPQFKDVTWTPGQKLQILVSSSMTYRTYTTIEWDSELGRTRIVGFAHGAGPGALWLRQARAGQACDVFGPRASLNLDGLDRPALLFGDETSFAVAASLQQKAAVSAVRHLFEVNSSRSVSAALDLASFGITDAKLYDRLPDDAHLSDIEAEMLEASDDVLFILTGKATSIQRLRGVLRRAGVPSGRVMTKAYWAPGKKGLD